MTFPTTYSQPKALSWHKGLLRRHPLVAYFVLASAIAWIIASPRLPLLMVCLAYPSRPSLVVTWLGDILSRFVTQLF